MPIALNLAPATRQPKYLRVAEQLAQWLAEGRFNRKGRLPTETALASHFKVNRLTLRKAIGILIDKGILIKEKGKGARLPAGRATPSPAGSPLVALVMIDTYETDYNTREIRCLERELARHHYSLACAWTTTTELMLGKLPPVLSNPSIVGIILDGSALGIHHAALAARLGVPGVFLGTHALPRDIPQSKCAYEDAFAAALRWLIGAPKHHVAMIRKAEERTNYLEHRLNAVYRKTMIDQGLPQWFLTAAEIDRLPHLMAQAGATDYSIFIADADVNGNAAPLQHGKKLFMGLPERVPENLRGRIGLLEMDPTVTIAPAVALLLALIQGETPAPCFEATPPLFLPPL